MLTSDVLADSRNFANATIPEYAVAYATLEFLNHVWKRPSPCSVLIVKNLEKTTNYEFFMS